MSPTSTIVTYPDLADSVVLVTGGSGGIGAATCRAFAASGARVAVNGGRPEPVASVVESVTTSGGGGPPQPIADVAGGQMI